MLRGLDSYFSPGMTEKWFLINFIARALLDASSRDWTCWPIGSSSRPQSDTLDFCFQTFPSFRPQIEMQLEDENIVFSAFKHAWTLGCEDIMSLQWRKVTQTLNLKKYLNFKWLKVSTKDTMFDQLIFVTMAGAIVIAILALIKVITSTVFIVSINHHSQHSITGDDWLSWLRRLVHEEHSQKDGRQDCCCYGGGREVWGGSCWRW